MIDPTNLAAYELSSRLARECVGSDLHTVVNAMCINIGYVIGQQPVEARQGMILTCAAFIREMSDSAARFLDTDLPERMN